MLVLLRLRALWLYGTQRRTSEVVDALAAAVKHGEARRVLNETPLAQRLPRRSIGKRLLRKGVVGADSKNLDTQILEF